MKVYIFGYNGNMAHRYRTILNGKSHQLGGGLEVGGEDCGTFYGFSLAAADAVIVATPTNTHCKILHQIKDCGKPILCEKPISTDLREVEDCIEALKASKTKLSMVSQYDYLVDSKSEGHTIYNYFKTGSDGLAWDCINIMKHAKGRVTLLNNSPIWHCIINGKSLDIRDMDYAYIEMMENWLAGRAKIDLDDIRNTHLKVSAYIEVYGQ